MEKSLTISESAQHCLDGRSLWTRGLLVDVGSTFTKCLVVAPDARVLGQSQSPTTIENDVFVGSGTQLVAPVTVGHEAYIAAGSCITDDVPSGSLAISRGQQQNKKGWATKKKSGNHDD